MPNVNISSTHHLRFMLRQTANGDGHWGDYNFHTDTISPNDDWLIVVDQPIDGLTTTPPKSRRMVFLTEPASIMVYNKDFLHQFAIVFSMSPLPWFEGDCRLSHTALPWFYGVDMSRSGGSAKSQNWHELSAPPTSTRDGLVSAICSTKSLTSDQVKRLFFLEKLKQRLPDQLSIYGRGFHPIDDKAQGLDDYRYHLVLENNNEPYGWTEKLADCILAGAYPIVSGGSDLAQFFDPNGFANIDLSEPLNAVEDVLKILASDPVSDRRVQEALEKNKKTLMMKQQFFPMSVAAMCDHEGPFDHLAVPDQIKRPVKSTGMRLKKRIRPLLMALTRFNLARKSKKTDRSQG